MRRLTFLAAALAAALPALASADEASDPRATVPPPAYRSALPAPTDLAEPTVPWTQANQDVARFPRGHADVLRWEERQESEAGPGPDTTPDTTPATPAARPEDRHGHAH